MDGVLYSSLTGTLVIQKHGSSPIALRGLGNTNGTLTAPGAVIYQDEVSTWNYAKSATEIAADAARTTPYTIAEIGLVSLAPLDDATIMMGGG